MKIIYIWDAYCGWCYGFNSVFKQFHDRHPELNIEVISGGLFIGENSKPIGTYGYFESGNQKIAAMFPVTFGEKNLQLIQEGTTVLDSDGPANAFAVMREQIPQAQWSELAFEIQQQYFVEGKSLSEVSTYTDLASKFQLDATLLVQQLTKALKENTLSQTDYNQARAMGVTSYPTVISEVNGQYFDFRGQATTVEDLEQHYQILLKEG
ncbi:DsbA family protein [Macrococcus sp. DPC7161]|uniref:DsbA family protein n=1 Tax=Macrococcus sp. DPC7161 TaxID=2507060 RepID=UPI00100B8EAB|nr:DsbA family protein [Macrococcus sp. DPC7161]RXK17497.1 thioredoxin [Macrococcus sp. DPC7161]